MGLKGIFDILHQTVNHDVQASSANAPVSSDPMDQPVRTLELIASLSISSGDLQPVPLSRSGWRPDHICVARVDLPPACFTAGRKSYPWHGHGVLAAAHDLYQRDGFRQSHLSLEYPK